MSSALAFVLPWGLLGAGPLHRLLVRVCWVTHILSFLFTALARRGFFAYVIFGPGWSEEKKLQLEEDSLS